MNSIKRDIVVIGASAGGVQTLQQLFSRVPADLKATFFVVMHISPYMDTVLPEILNRAGTLPVVQARSNERFHRGRVYIAPPDRHLIVRRGKTIVEAGPRENFSRPAIDPLFRSAARSYGTRVIGIVLSGLLDDGTSGLAEIRKAGGITIVQDPEDALHPDMPLNALRSVDVDYTLPVDSMATLLEKLIEEDAPQPVLRIVDEDPKQLGEPSVYSCPDCGGVLWEIGDDKLVRFRCRVGHTYGTESLGARQAEDVERALWASLTALEEASSFARRMAIRSRERGHRLTAENYERKWKVAEDDAHLVRGLLFQKQTVYQPEEDEDESDHEETELESQ